MGRLVIKNNKYYVIVSYKDPVSGKYKNKWYATGLDAKNNKRKAIEFMNNLLAEKPVIQNSKKDILFCDYIRNWFKSTEPNLQATSYGSYSYIVNAILDYFKDKNLMLSEITAFEIQQYYNWLREQGKSVHVCLHHHVVLHKALKTAYKLDMINSNPVDKVDRPRPPKYIAKFFTIDETISFLEKAKDDYLFYAYFLTLIYGLRRSEMIGLKWEAIDFTKGTISIEHVVVETSRNGKKIEIAKDIPKNKSSYRTYPLIPAARTVLLNLKKQQELNKHYFKDCYSDSGYVYQDEFGARYKTGRIYSHFQLLLKEYGFTKIRFHDLRHTCASILIAYGVGLKHIQHWLGHSTYSTTADIYTHLVFSDKITVGEAFTKLLTNSGEQLNKDKELITGAINEMFQSETEEETLIEKEEGNTYSQPIIIDYKKYGFATFSDYIKYLEELQKNDFEL